MIVLLSPAKTLDYDTPTPPELVPLQTRPHFVQEAAALIEILRGYTPVDLARLMDLSDNLAQLNVARFAAWSTRFTAHNSKPAVLAFAGDVYEGLQAPSLSVADMQWAQDHVRILSGLYGLLRPLDRLQPYRLEMGTRLAHDRGSDLYSYWSSQLTYRLNTELSRQATPWILNLASQEYAKAVQPQHMPAPWVDCVFEDGKAGSWKVISFHAKRARGLMARFVIQQRLTEVAQLKDFDAEGYAYQQGLSSARRLVFRRPEPR